MKKYLSTVLLGLAAMQTIPLVQAAEPAGPLFTSPLPILPPDQEVRIDQVTLQPGVGAPVHRHDSYVYVYVIEGTVDMQVEGGEVQHLTAGQVFTENPDDIHTMMKNPSAVDAARFVSFTIKTAGAPPGTILAPNTR